MFSWPDKLTSLLHITIPIIQAPMAGGISTPEMVAAVSNAGGLGSFAAGYMQPDTIREAIRQIRSLTDKPFAVNLFIPETHHASLDQISTARHIVQNACTELHFEIPSIHSPYAPDFMEQIKIIVEENISILSFTFGVPDAKLIDQLKNKNIKLIGTATTLAEAQILEINKIDCIVAQGLEAGGHRGTFIGSAENALVPLSTLLSQLTTLDTPIIAAGAIMNANNIVSALKQGAIAVQMGTAFLCCEESGIHPEYKKLLLNTKKDNTILTRAFSGKLARGLRNKFIERMKAHENSILNYPIQNALTTSMRKEASKQNNTDFMSMWAGQGVSLCRPISASTLIEELNEEVLMRSNKNNT